MNLKGFVWEDSRKCSCFGKEKQTTQKRKLFSSNNRRRERCTLNRYRDVLCCAQKHRSLFLLKTKRASGQTCCAPSTLNQSWVLLAQRSEGRQTSSSFPTLAQTRHLQTSTGSACSAQESLCQVSGVKIFIGNPAFKHHSTFFINSELQQQQQQVPCDLEQWFPNWGAGPPRRT